MGDVEGSRFKYPDHLAVDLHGRAPQTPAVDAQKHVCGSESNALVAIHERVIDRQAFQQGGLGLSHMRRTAMNIARYRVVPLLCKD